MRWKVDYSVDFERFKFKQPENESHLSHCVDIHYNRQTPKWKLETLCEILCLVMSPNELSDARDALEAGTLKRGSHWTDEQWDNYLLLVKNHKRLSIDDIMERLRPLVETLENDPRLATNR